MSPIIITNSTIFLWFLFFKFSCTSVLNLNITSYLIFASNPLHRYEFCEPKFFSKTCKFSIIFYSTWQLSGGGQWRKACRSRKKNRNSRKSRENSRNLLEVFLRSRKEQNLYGHCDMNNARRILSKGSTLLRVCLFLSTKLLFQNNFCLNFIAVEGVRQFLTERYRNWISLYLDVSPSWSRHFQYFGFLTVAPATNFARKRVKTRYLTLFRATKNCVVICSASLLYEMGYAFRSQYLYLWNFRTFFAPS